jgi:hypothetical protein
MVKCIIAMFLVCILLTQSGCSGFDKWLVEKGLSSKVENTELNQQREDRIFTQWKNMMVEEY